MRKSAVTYKQVLFINSALIIGLVACGPKVGSDSATLSNLTDFGMRGAFRSLSMECVRGSSRKQIASQKQLKRVLLVTSGNMQVTDSNTYSYLSDGSEAGSQNLIEVFTKEYSYSLEMDGQQRKAHFMMNEGAGSSHLTGVGDLAVTDSTMRAVSRFEKSLKKYDATYEFEKVQAQNGSEKFLLKMTQTDVPVDVCPEAGSSLVSTFERIEI